MSEDHGEYFPCRTWRMRKGNLPGRDVHMQKSFQKLYTTEGETLSGIPWERYPRPQMKRERWLCLNGDWSLRTEDGQEGTIRVPFCPESLLSGFDGPVRYGEALCYERTFVIPKDWAGMRVLLHFGAVSSRCEVFVDGEKVCEHENGYLSFSADISEVIRKTEENVRERTNEDAPENARGQGDALHTHHLTVRAWNDLSEKLPYGKQRIKRGGMWYTPVSGIWQTVWLEPVPEKYVQRLIIRADAKGAEIQVLSSDLGDAEIQVPCPEAGSSEFSESCLEAEGYVTCEGKRYELQGGRVRIEPEHPRLWSPETPNLYEFTVTRGEDCVTSYFALRSLSIEQRNGKPRLCLNGEPYFFHGLLDQGYFSDGIYTPAAPELYEKDVLAMKELGFNMLRKHIKIEPEQFYYDCDRLGMIVFQDMVNNGKYRYFRDTIFPTFGFCSENDHKKHPDPEARAAFMEGMRQTVSQLSNHPCISYWTIFNEGWGQFEADKAYDALKALDGDRFVDSTSGWFHQKKSDVDSLHVYFQKLHLGKQRELVQVLSEFGGYVYKEPKHSHNLQKTYGYKIFKDRKTFAAALRDVYLKELVPLAEQGLCASVYTQVSDVEDETNGILTYDRRVCKLQKEEMDGIAEALQEAVRK